MDPSIIDVENMDFNDIDDNLQKKPPKIFIETHDGAFGILIKEGALLGNLSLTNSQV